MQGIVFNIQKFCINDGPGIRTNVFLKGCPLKCLWCHNPESQKVAEEISYIAHKCIGCGRCVAVCPEHAHSFVDGVHIFDRSKCKVCGKCAEECVAEALEKVGKPMTVDEVLEEVMKDKAFYDTSGGGMTVSGGEPTLQFDFVYALLKEAKARGLHTCIETCGFTSKDKIGKLAEVVDIFLYDWKVTETEKHRVCTGGTNSIIRENLQYVDSLGAASILRCPIIPSVNDTEDHFAGIAALADSLKHIQGVEIEPYHSLGNDKLERIGRTVAPEQKYEMPEKETVDQWIQAIQAKTKVPVRRA